MAQVATPRFYVNVVEWLDSLGMSTELSRYTHYGSGGVGEAAVQQLPMSFWHLKSASISRTLRMNNVTGSDNLRYISIPPQGVSLADSIGSNGFWAILGHDFSSWDDFIINLNPSVVNTGLSQSRVVNWNGRYSPVPYSGFSIATCDLSGSSTPPDNTPVGGIFQMQSGDLSDLNPAINCIVLGSYHDMSHAVDLNLTMTREYGGVKTIETRGGSSLSNTFYTKPPKWGEREAWQLGDKDFSAGGRRIFDLSFSYLSDSSVFPDNPTEIGDGDGWEVDETTPDFISEVLKKTRGSMLPFIFQPNTDENIFAICKFDQNSFSFQQQSPNLYSCKVRIRECW